MDTPPIVSPEEWEAARAQLLVKEKELSRTRDAMAAERRRMPWLAVPNAYETSTPPTPGRESREMTDNRTLTVLVCGLDEGVPT